MTPQNSITAKDSPPNDSDKDGRHRLWGDPLVLTLLGVVLSAAVGIGTAHYVESGTSDRADRQIEADKDLAELTWVQELILADASRDDLSPENASTVLRKRLCGIWSGRTVNTEAWDHVNGYVTQNNFCNASDPILGVFARPIADEAQDARLLRIGCLSAAAKVSQSCRAYDRSGLHSRPRDSCAMSLEAKSDDHVLVGISVVEESYRQPPDGKPTASEALRDLLMTDATPKAVRYTVECTNSAGTRRTCESRVTMIATSVPQHCATLLQAQLQ